MSKELLEAAITGSEADLRAALTTIGDNKQLYEDKDIEGSTAILLAAKHGHTLIIDILIEAGASLAATNQEGLNILQIARLAKKEAVVSLLTQKHSAFLPADKEDSRVAEAAQMGKNIEFWQAAEQGDLHKLEKLRSTGVDVKSADPDGRTALHRAAYKDHIDILDHLLTFFAIGLTYTDKKGRTVLHEAAMGDSEKAIDFIIKRLETFSRRIGSVNRGSIMPDFVDVPDKEGSTPLLLAAQNGNTWRVEQFIKKHKANIQWTRNDGKNVLDVAASHGYEATVRHLVDNGYIDKKNIPRALLHATAGGHQELIATLLRDYHISLNTQDEEGNTPLLTAAANGQNDTIDYLLSIHKENGEDLDIILNNKNNPGYNLVLNAVANGHLTTVKHLLQRHGNVLYLSKRDAQGKQEILRDDYGNSAALIAAKHGQNAMIDWLQAQGSDLENERNAEGFNTFLMAAIYNQLKTLEHLINHHHLDPKRQKDLRGNNTLLLAVLFKRANIVQLLIQNKLCDPKETNAIGMSALIAAAQSGDSDLLRFFIEEIGLDPDARMQDGSTAVLRAAEYGESSSITVLVEDCMLSFDQKDCQGRTAFLRAAENGKKDTLKELQIQYKINLESERDAQGNTALLVAASSQYDPSKTLYPLFPKETKAVVIATEKQTFEKGILAVIQYLSENGVNPVLEKNNNQDTALHCAASTGNDEVIKFLGNKNIYNKNQQGRIPIHLAIEQGRISTVELLKSFDGGQLKARDASGYTPLLIAAAHGQISMLDALLQNHQASLKEEDAEGNNALLVVALHGQWQMVDHLIKKYPINLEFKNRRGDTALHLACQRGHLETVRYLFNLKNAQLSPNSQNELGNSPMMVAAAHGQNSILEYFFKNRISLNQRNYKGDGLLYMAAENQHVETLRFLLNLGAIIDSRNHENETPTQKVEKKLGRGHPAFILLRCAEKLIQAASQNTETPRGLRFVLKTLKQAVNARREKDGNTALHCSVINSNDALISALFESGANFELLNNRLMSPLALQANVQSPFTQGIFAIAKLKTICARETAVLQPNAPDPAGQEIKHSAEYQEQLKIANETIQRLKGAKFATPPQYERDFLCLKLAEVFLDNKNLYFNPKLAYELLLQIDGTSSYLEPAHRLIRHLVDNCMPSQSLVQMTEIQYNSAATHPATLVTPLYQLRTQIERTSLGQVSMGNGRAPSSPNHGSSASMHNHHQ